MIAIPVHLETRRSGASEIIGQLRSSAMTGFILIDFLFFPKKQELQRWQVRVGQPTTRTRMREGVL